MNTKIEEKFLNQFIVKEKSVYHMSYGERKGRKKRAVFAISVRKC